MSELLSQLGIDWRLLLAQLFNFILLLIVLERFVYRPVLKVINDRKTQIEENNKHEKLLETKLAEIHSIRENILAEAREKGEKVRAEALARAEAAESHILAEAEERAKALIEAETRKFASEVRRIEESIQSEVGTLLTQAVEKSLGDLLDKEAKQKILTRSIEHFKSEYSTKDFKGTIVLEPR